MGTKYPSTAISGFNSSPPPDDGSTGASNLITWSGIKTKIGDPLNTALAAVNTALVSAFDYSVRRITAADSTIAGDHMRTIEIAPTVTNTVTISLGDAATMTSNYLVAVKNSSAVAQIVSRVTSGDTIDGVAGNLTIPAGASLRFSTNAAANGYLVQSASTGPVFKQQTRTVLTSGSAATYTTPVGATRILVRLVGPGGGGAAAATNSGNNGSGATTFGTLSAGAGQGGAVGAAGGAGGASSGGDLNFSGQNGIGGVSNVTADNLGGGAGGSSIFGGAGVGTPNANGTSAATNSGSGGAGGGNAVGNVGGGGGAGGFCEKLLTAPALTYTYTIGTKGTGGAAGTKAGGDGADGIIIVDEFYN